jgi:hypothetical protein
MEASYYFTLLMSDIIFVYCCECYIIGETPDVVPGVLEILRSGKTVANDLEFDLPNGVPLILF